MKVAKLVCVLGDADTNSNKYYNMTQISSTEFEAKWGRVGGSEAQQVYPMSQWDKIYRDKTKPSKKPKPYTDVTELYAQEEAKADGKAAPAFEIVSSARNKALQDVVKRLLAYARKSVAANYTVSSEAVTPKQVERAQAALDAISVVKVDTLADLKGVNERLLDFFTIVPRKMKDVRDHLLRADDLTGAPALFASIVANEQDTLDQMAGQVSLLGKGGADAPAASAGKDSLGLIGVDADLVTDARELAQIRSLMQSKGRMFKHAFKVRNERTQALYDRHHASARNKYNELFWHGSRSENWWSILEKGLLIRPTGAAYTGSMFGDGIYFASEFDKSLGYTSINSSRWAGGNQNNAFLALYRVHLGNQYVTQRAESHLTLKHLQRGGFDSTHGKKGPALMRDEYIVYQPQQCTVEYLVEVEGSQH